MLVSGLVIWVLVHLFPSLLPAQRDRLAEKLGAPYQGIFALCILTALLLNIFGWRGAVPAQVYIPPGALRLPSMLLTVLGLILFVSASFPATRIKRVLRHPQLTGVLLWSLAHLLVNGDSRSLPLFGVIGAWSLVEMVTISRRDGAWQKPDTPAGWTQDILILVIGLAASALAIYFHPYLSGVALIA